MKPKIAVVLVVSLLGLFFTGHFYAAAPISGTIVDGQTGAPVEGAVVLAHWQVNTGGFADEEGCVSEMAIREAVTDKDGHYSLSGWGPRYAGCLAFPNFRQGMSPQILVFKPGYRPEVRQNEHSGDSDSAFLRHSEWNGRSIPIEHFFGTPQDYAERVRYLSQAIDDISENCCWFAPWTKMPMMYAALQQQALDFKAVNISRLSVLPQRLPPEMQQKPCPSHTEILNMCTIDGKLVYQIEPCPPGSPGTSDQKQVRTVTPSEC